MDSDRQYDELSEEQLEKLRLILETFEKSLRDDNRPTIESQLATVSAELHLPLFIELLHIELGSKMLGDELPDISNYHARFPDYTNQIQFAFDAIGPRGSQPLTDETRFHNSNNQDLGESHSGESGSGESRTLDYGGLASNDRIGSYTLLEPIGEGGMGLVWKAEQKSPVRRDVALKIIKAGMDTREVIARFEAERQALALMSHPNIAKVFDAGATETGRPYFVMELVNGEPITSFCDRQKMSADERIKLIMDVCYAVQHAHQRGIIHRDIKPSNVLVTMDREKPFVKVIDFGLAKAVSQKLTEKTLFTAVGQVVGTPAYMSPEQIERGGLDVDTRTDVYSLGVLLYELLTGVTPLDMKQLRSAGYAEMLKLICETQPPRMRQRLSSLGADSKPMALKRDTDIKRLCRRLQGDLDVIVMNALAKEPNRRYSSPNDFADDLQRFLNREPIEARPASAVYRFKKLADRNKGKFVAAGLLMLALIGGFVGTALGLFEAKRQTEIAQKNLVAAEENYELARGAVDSYFTSVSENKLLNEPYMDGLRRELLTSARQFYQNFVYRRQDDPDALLDLATAHLRLGGISARMGDPDQAMIEIEACRSAAKRAIGSSYQGESERLQLECDIYVAEQFMKRGEYKEAIKILDGALEMAETAKKNYPELNRFEHKLAILFSKRAENNLDLNQLKAAESDYQSSIAILEKLAESAPDERKFSRDLATAFENLGTMIYEQERLAEGGVLIDKAIVIWRRKVNEEEYSVDSQHGLADSLIVAANILRREGKHEEAVKLGEESARIGRELVANHPELVTLQNALISQLGNLSVVYKVAGNQEQADALNLEVMKMLKAMQAKFPNDVFHSLRLGSVQGNEGNSKFAAGEWLESIRWFDLANETLEVLLTKSKADPRARRIMRNNHWGRADAFTKLEQYDKAIEAFDATIEMASADARPQIRLERALVLIKKGDYEAAAKTVEEVSPDINLDLLGRESNVAIVWFKAGGVLAEAANAANQDPELNESQKAVRTKELRTQAISVLRNALEFGHFEKPKSKPLRTGPFNSLHEYPEFQQLLIDADLESKQSEN